MATEVVSVEITGDASSAQAAAQAAAASLGQLGAAGTAASSGLGSVGSATTSVASSLSSMGGSGSQAASGLTSVSGAAQGAASGVQTAGGAASSASGGFSTLHSIVGASAGMFSGLGGSVGGAASVLSSASGVANQASQAFAGMGGSLAAVAGPAGAAAAAIGAVVAVSAGAAASFLSTEQNADKMATKFGSTSGEIKAFEDAFKEAGEAPKVFDDAMAHVSAMLPDLAKGLNPLRKEFADLNVDVHDSNGVLKDSATIVEDVADAYFKSTDKTKAFNDVQKILGPTFAASLKVVDASPASMAKLDEGLSHAADTTRQISKDSSEYTKAQGEMNAAMEKIGQSAAPAFVGSLKGIAEVVGALEKVITPAIKTVDALSSALGTLAGVHIDLGSLITGTLNPVVGAASAVNSLVNMLGGGETSGASGGGGGTYASGTSYAPGGLSLVGEQGPELVSLPRGAAVSNANRTAGMMSSMGGTTINQITVNAPNFIGSYDDFSSAMTRSLSEMYRRGILSGSVFASQSS